MCVAAVNWKTLCEFASYETFTFTSIDNLSISHGHGSKDAQDLGISVIHRRDIVLSAIELSHGWEILLMHSDPGCQRVTLALR